MCSKVFKLEFNSIYLERYFKKEGRLQVIPVLELFLCYNKNIILGFLWSKRRFNMETGMKVLLDESFRKWKANEKLSS